MKRRKELSPKIDKLQLNGISPGSQPLVLWKNREVAAQRMKYVPGKEDSPDETLRKWLRRDEVDRHERPGATSSERERIRELERETRELRRANEILKAASAFFARELDPRLPTP